MKMNKLLTSQVEQKSNTMQKDHLKMKRLRTKTMMQKADIERLNLAMKRRTKQNEKKLTIAQRKVIANQYRKLNECANTLFKKEEVLKRVAASK